MHVQHVHVDCVSLYYVCMNGLYSQNASAKAFSVFLGEMHGLTKRGTRVLTFSYDLQVCQYALRALALHLMLSHVHQVL